MTVVSLGSGSKPSEPEACFAGVSFSWEGGRERGDCFFEVGGGD